MLWDKAVPEGGKLGSCRNGVVGIVRGGVEVGIGLVLMRMS